MFKICSPTTEHERGGAPFRRVATVRIRSGSDFDLLSPAPAIEIYGLNNTPSINYQSLECKRLRAKNEYVSAREITRRGPDNPLDLPLAEVGRNGDGTRSPHWYSNEYCKGNEDLQSVHNLPP
jgi:hypothetical protein